MLFWIFSCHSFHEETISLDKLLTQYDRTIETNHHLYVLKSKFSCDGCIDIIFEQFNNSLTNTLSHNITIISYDKDEIPKSLLEKVEFVHDSSFLVDSYFINSANVVLFETNNKKVIQYFPITKGDPIEFTSALNQFLMD